MWSTFSRVAKDPLLIAVIAISSLLPVIYLGWPRVVGSVNQETSAGGVPIDGDNLVSLLAGAEASVGFTPLLPSHLPTSADELVLVDASAGPSGEGLRLIELVYRSAESAIIDGREAFHLLEMFQVPIRLNSANGDLLSSDMAGFEVHRDIVSVDSGGNPIKVTYTARSADRTYVMDFTGHQPGEDGLRRMLESLEPFEP